MKDLSASERELVAIGAAVASNCVPCIEYHVPEARKAGLTDSQISQAVRLADKVRQVPAAKVLAVAFGLLGESQPVSAETGCASVMQTAAGESKSSDCCS